jgi:hypothetical protein
MAQTSTATATPKTQGATAPAVPVETAPAAPSIVIPEEFDKRQGITPDYTGHVDGKPEGYNHVWVRHPKFNDGGRWSLYMQMGYAPVTKDEFKKLGLKFPGSSSYLQTDPDHDWVMNADTVLLMGNLEAKNRALRDIEIQSRQLESITVGGLVDGQLKSPSRKTFEGTFDDGAAMLANAAD